MRESTHWLRSPEELIQATKTCCSKEAALDVQVIIERAGGLAIEMSSGRLMENRFQDQRKAVSCAKFVNGNE